MWPSTPSNPAINVMRFRTWLVRSVGNWPTSWFVEAAFFGVEAHLIWTHDADWRPMGDPKRVHSHGRNPRTMADVRIVRTAHTHSSILDFCLSSVPEDPAFWQFNCACLSSPIKTVVTQGPRFFEHRKADCSTTYSWEQLGAWCELRRVSRMTLTDVPGRVRSPLR